MTVLTPEQLRAAQPQIFDQPEQCDSCGAATDRLHQLNWQPFVLWACDLCVDALCVKLPNISKDTPA